MLQPLTIRLSKDALKEILAISNSTGRTSAEIARTAIDRGLREMEMFKDIDLDDMAGIAKDLPAPLKRFLLDQAILSCLVEDLIDHLMPHKDKNPDRLMERAVQKIQAVYFSEKKDELKKRKWL